MPRPLRTVCGISIHALREEGDHFRLDAVQELDISIHALREEGDMPVPFLFCFTQLFLSTPSARRATHPALRRDRILRISIHALREEGDSPAVRC